MTNSSKAFLFLCGCMAGAWGGFFALNAGSLATFLSDSRLTERDAAVLPASRQSITQRADTQDPRSQDLQELTATVEQIDDVELLLSRINELTQASSPRSKLELHILLARLIELDPGLAALKSIDDTQKSQAIANALLNVLGDDEVSIVRILAALPRVNSLTFRVNAAADAVERDPDEVLARVLSSDDAVFRRAAIPAIAAAWAESDPLAALANADRISEPRLRETFELEVLHEWARVESAGAIAHLRNAASTMLPQLGSGVESLRSTFEILAMSDPEQVLDLSRQLSRWNLFDAAVTVAVRSLAQQYPVAAVSYLDTLPRGQEHRLSRAAVAAGYVDRDPESALVWAQSLNPPSPGTVNAVLTAFALQDLERVVDIVVAEIARGSGLGIDPREWMNRSADSATMARIGTRIASLGPDAARQLMARFAELWAGSDPEAALQWARQNGEVGEQILPQLALSFRPETFELGMAMADQMQGEIRRQWMLRVARTTGSRELARDPEGFVQTLTRYSGDPAYPTIIAILASAVASRNTFGSPAEVERIVQSLPHGELRSAIEQRIGAQQL